jgi:hypothetical protein
MATLPSASLAGMGAVYQTADENLSTRRGNPKSSLSGSSSREDFRTSARLRQKWRFVLFQTLISTA